MAKFFRFPLNLVLFLLFFSTSSLVLGAEKGKNSAPAKRKCSRRSSAPAPAPAAEEYPSALGNVFPNNPLMQKQLLRALGRSSRRVEQSAGEVYRDGVHVLSEKIDALKAKIQELQSRLKTEAQEGAAMKAQLQYEKKQNSILMQSLKKIDEQLTLKQAELDKKTADLADTKQDLEMTESLVRSAAGASRELREAVQELEGKKSALQAKMFSSQVQMSALQDQIATLQSQNLELNRQNKILRDRLTRGNSQVLYYRAPDGLFYPVQ